MAWYKLFKTVLQKCKKKRKFISNERLTLLLSEENFKLDIQFYTYGPYNNIINFLIWTLIVENSVKGLQEEEVAFLDHVSDQQIAIEKARNNEEARVIRELRISFLHVMCNVWGGLNFCGYPCPWINISTYTYKQSIKLHPQKAFQNWINPQKFDPMNLNDFTVCDNLGN